MTKSPKNLVLLALLTAACGMVGCAANLGSSTLLTMQEMTSLKDSIIEDIAMSSVMRNRTSQSKEMVLSIGSVENRSADVFTKSEQWYLMQSVARVIANPTGMGADRNITIVMPPEAIEHISRRGSVWRGFANDRSPTHVLNGDFRSISRATKDERTDLFVFAYQIKDIESGEIVVDKDVEINKRAAGRLFN